MGAESPENHQSSKEQLSPYFPAFQSGLPVAYTEARPLQTGSGSESQDFLTLPLDAHEVFTVTKNCIYRPSPNHQRKLRNNLLFGVGFLELANSGDFAANVWNHVPVPHFAIALMAIGGTAALFTSVFAFRDLRLSWRNLCLLRDERGFFKSQRQTITCGEEGKGIACGDLESWLSINFREMGSELIDRFVMDILLGAAAVLVGVGTFLAIGGANKSVFFASNLLSGYIGNAPGAIFGLLNAAWTGYLVIRFHRHNAAVASEPIVTAFKSRLRTRFHKMQRHSATSGISGLVAGAAGLVTATMWWGYVVLIACIIAQIYCNHFWRQSIGYDRSIIQSSHQMRDYSVLEKMEQVISIQQILCDNPDQALAKLIPDPNSLASILRFILENDMFDEFCLYLLNDPNWLCLYPGVPHGEELSISPQDLLVVDGQAASRTLESAKTFIRRTGPQHFEYMERFLLEMTGCRLYHGYRKEGH